MGLDEFRWKLPSILWILIITTTTIFIAINIMQQEYRNLETAVIYEANRILSEEVDTNGFVIKTKGCRIPEFKPLNSDVQKFIFQEKPIICNKGIPPLVESNLTSLIILTDSLLAYNVNNTSYLSCCYTSFKRKDPKPLERDNNKVQYRKSCVYFNKSVNVKDEYVKVQCFYFRKLIYSDFFSFVPIKETLSNQKKNQNKLNVLIVGIDSVSRLNFYRQMPKTIAALKNLKAVELLGYNKVADNTFPNLIPVLTGLTETELRKCWPNTKSYFDNCPFIWKTLKTNGYTTAFAEDSSWMGLFNYLKQGFKHQPTDYYWNTFESESDKQLGNNHRINVNQCVGSREPHANLMSYAMKYVETMTNNNITYFGFFWSSSLSHDLLNKPHLGDELFAKFITRLNKHALLLNTAFVFMSDHGIRWGDIRSTFQGRIEERLPFLYVYLPEWYKQEYQLVYSNLMRNSKRLTTPFDLHETLKDLLNSHKLTREYLNERQQTNTKKRAYSLFETISPDRTCDDASIASHWCTCQESVPVKTNTTIIQKAANFSVTYINKLLVGYADCVKLVLDKVIDSRMQTHNKDILRKDSDEDYIITFKTKPSDALFEVTVRKKHGKQKYNFEIVGTISRINLYRDQSLCITDFHLKLYCFCKHLL